MTLSLGALAIAKEQIGRREAAGKKNQGAIVTWSLEGLTSRPADDPTSPGWALWCAFFACQCYRRALLLRGDTKRLREWQRIASGSCDALWRKAHEGDLLRWTNGPPPEPGDIFFIGKTGDLKHCGLVGSFGDSQRVTVEGNSGPQASEVWRGHRKLQEVYGFVRVLM